MGTVKKIGDKIYAYSDPSGKSRLVRGDPPGFTLNDYETFGGAMPDGIDAYAGGPGVSIFQISGKDLILTNSEDNNRWLYKWVGQ